MDETFISHLRKALNNLYDLRALRQNPLCRDFVVGSPFDAAPRLQHLLEEAIAALKPKAGASHGSSNWETYELLSLRYLQQFSQKEVADQLGISLSQMNRVQQKALEILAVTLWEKYHLADRLDTEKKTEEKVPGAAIPPEDPGAHLDWMATVSSEKSAVLEEHLADVLEILRPFFDKYAVTLEISLPPGPIEVLVYPMALRQILLNLLTIAIPLMAKGCIQLGAEMQENWVVLILDGIHTLHEPAALTEDMQVNLGIAADLAQRSGVELNFQLESRKLHTSLHLPIRASLPILVIDDGLDFLQLLERYVANTRYRLVTTSDPQQAVPLAESSAAKAIVVDVMMPRIDGWALLQRLRNHPMTANTPVVICSILRQEELASALGASAYLSKPVNQAEFLALLDSLTQGVG